jgi:hypothetical protein
MLGESDTRAKLIDPALHSRGWTEDLIRREETAGAIESPLCGRWRRSRGRTDYVLRVRVNPGTQPVAVALIEAKRSTSRPGTGWSRPSQARHHTGPAKALAGSKSNLRLIDGDELVNLVLSQFDSATRAYYPSSAFTCPSHWGRRTNRGTHPPHLTHNLTHT